MFRVRVALFIPVVFVLLLYASLPMTRAKDTMARQQGRVLFQDDFSDNSAGWPTRNANVKYTLAKGTYTVQIQPTLKFAGIMMIPTTKDDYLTSDFEFSVDVSKVIVSTPTYCIMLVFNAQADYSGVYRYFICSNDHWYLWDTQGQIGSAPIDQPVDFTGSNPQTVGLRYEAGTYTMLLNGETIGQLDHETTINGWAGFGISHEKDGGGATITGTFDNFEVQSVEPPVQQVDTPTPTTPPSGEIFRDEFNNNDADWEVGNGQGYQSQIANGAYLIRLDTNYTNGRWDVAPGFNDWSKAPILTDSFEMQFDISSAKCRGNDCYVVLLFNVQQSYADYDVLYYDSNRGQWILYQKTLDSPLASGTVDHKMGNVFNGGTHTLRLQVQPTNLVLFQDDEQVVRIAYSLDINGSVGFGLGRETSDSPTTMIATFDNFIVRTLG